MDRDPLNMVDINRVRHRATEVDISKDREDTAANRDTADHSRDTEDLNKAMEVREVHPLADRTPTLRELTELIYEKY